MPDHSSEKRLLNLLDALAHDACTDAEEAASGLREVGLDPEEVEQRGVLFVQQLQGRTRLSLAKAKRQRQEHTLAALRERAADLVRAAGDNAKDALRRLLANREPDFELSFRKIESLEAEDALDVLSEAELLRLLDELEDEE